MRVWKKEIYGLVSRTEGESIFEWNIRYLNGRANCFILKRCLDGIKGKGNLVLVMDRSSFWSGLRRGDGRDSFLYHGIRGTGQSLCRTDMSRILLCLPKSQAIWCKRQDVYGLER